MLRRYIGTDEFEGYYFFCGHAFGRFGLFVDEDRGQFGEISEGGWNGGIYDGGLAKQFHELYAVLDAILWTGVSVLKNSRCGGYLWC